MIRGRFGITKKKYKNVRTEIDGINFDSKAEASFFYELKLLERAGEVVIKELQPKVYLTKAKILFKLDFLIEENGELVYIDIKGFSTAVFNIKKRLWSKYGKGKLRIIKQDGTRFKTVEEIQTDTGL